MRIWKRPRCGDPYETLIVECGRREGHRGDHRCKLVWPQRVPMPPAEPRELTPQEAAMQRIWGKMLTAQLQTNLVRSTADLRARLDIVPLRIVNRDAAANSYLEFDRAMQDDPVGTVADVLGLDGDNG